MKTFRIADNIVFENENFIAINKPAGISSLHERLGEAISIIELVKKVNPDQMKKQLGSTAEILKGIFD